MSASAVLIVLAGALGVTAHFERGHEQKIVFDIRNEGQTTAKLDTFHSPCNPLRVSVLVVESEGPGSTPVRPVPYLEHYSGETISLAPGEVHTCAYDISYWFHGKLPPHPKTALPYDQAQIVWSFRPQEGSGYSEKLYGGVFSLFP